LFRIMIRHLKFFERAVLRQHDDACLLIREMSALR